MPTRNAINAVTFLPGVNTADINRDSNFNGLPDSFVAITLDGVNNNDNFNKSTEGLFAMVTPRQDAIEAVTVTTAAGGADVGGHGAVSINFATRSGTNRFTGSAYEYDRAPGLNTNYFFNELNEPGEKRRQGQSVRLQAGRPDRHPRSLQRARQGLLLLQLRRDAVPQQRDAHADGAEAGCAARHFPLGSQTGKSARRTLLDLMTRNSQAGTVDPLIEPAAR